MRHTTAKNILRKLPDPRVRTLDEVIHLCSTEGICGQRASASATSPRSKSWSECSLAVNISSLPGKYDMNARTNWRSSKPSPGRYPGRNRHRSPPDVHVWENKEQYPVTGETETPGYDGISALIESTSKPRRSLGPRIQGPSRRILNN
jgi:hypothetical protein